MTFSFMDLITIGGFCIAVMGFCLGFVKWNSSQLHGRITQVKADLDKQLSEVRETTVHRNEFTGAFEVIKEMMKEIKEDVRWLMQNSQRTRTGDRSNDS